MKHHKKMDNHLSRTTHKYLENPGDCMSNKIFVPLRQNQCFFWYCGVLLWWVAPSAFSRINVLQLFNALMAELVPAFFGCCLLPTPFLFCTCQFFLFNYNFIWSFFFDKEFGPSCMTCTQGKYVRNGFPLVLGVLDCGVFWCGCGVFPRSPQ